MSSTLTPVQATGPIRTRVSRDAEPYDVLLLKKDRAVDVFARH